jgi:formylglycine-generating enzyme required for sulfatase activity
LLNELRAARAESDRLFSILKPSALYERPIAERHRVVFYIGHLDGFDSILLSREGIGMPSPDAALDQLFEAGIDPDSAHLPKDTPGDWPSLDQLRAYVRRSRARVDQYIERAPEEVVHMAIEHRLMHLETLAYMFHNFRYELKNAPSDGTSLTLRDRGPANEWIDIPKGETILGNLEGDSFGWDNEYGPVGAAVGAFRIQRYSVTNGDYLRFVDQGANLPHFWVRRRDAICYRGMFEEYKLPLDCPVYVTLCEAEAYAKWLGKSLPSEEQFHHAAYGEPGGEIRTYPWGSLQPSPRFGNFDFKRWDPEAVDATPAGDSAFGVSQLVGNGWQWTNTPFAPFPGFEARRAYPGYSANFLVGEK